MNHTIPWAVAEVQVSLPRTRLKALVAQSSGGQCESWEGPGKGPQKCSTMNGTAEYTGVHIPYAKGKIRVLLNRSSQNDMTVLLLF